MPKIPLQSVWAHITLYSTSLERKYCLPIQPLMIFLQSNGSSSSSFEFVRTQNDTENKLVPKSCIAQYQHKHNTNSKHFMTCEPF